MWRFQVLSCGSGAFGVLPALVCRYRRIKVMSIRFQAGLKWRTVRLETSIVWTVPGHYAGWICIAIEYRGVNGLPLSVQTGVGRRSVGKTDLRLLCCYCRTFRCGETDGLIALGLPGCLFARSWFRRNCMRPEVDQIHLPARLISPRSWELQVYTPLYLFDSALGRYLSNL